MCGWVTKIIISVLKGPSRRSILALPAQGQPGPSDDDGVEDADGETCDDNGPLAGPGLSVLGASDHLRGGSGHVLFASRASSSLLLS